MKDFIKFFKDLTDAIAKKIEPGLKNVGSIQRKINIMLLLLALISLFLNISACIRVYSNVPFRDRASRAEAAASSSWFYNSGPLEPLPVFALKIPMSFFKADPAKVQRTEGCIMFLLIFLAFIYVVKARTQLSSALYASVIMSGLPWMGYYGMSGSAMLFSIFFLLLYWDFSDPDRLTLRRAVYAGLFAAAACLSRSDSIFFIMINTAFFLPEYMKIKAWRHLGIIFGMVLFLCSPYALWQKYTYGNAFFGQEMGLTRLINAEIQNSGAEIPFVREPTGLLTFLFRDGFVSGIAEPFRGLIRALSYEFPRAIYYKLAVLLAFIGFYFAFINGKKSIYALWLSAFIPVCFIANMNVVLVQGGIPLEYYLASLPGILAAAGYGLQESSSALADYIAKNPDKFHL